jgi:hypothetical protein
VEGQTTASTQNQAPGACRPLRTSGVRLGSRARVSVRGLMLLVALVAISFRTFDAVRMCRRSAWYRCFWATTMRWSGVSATS